MGVVVSVWGGQKKEPAFGPAHGDPRLYVGRFDAGRTELLGVSQHDHRL
jgi:hypothetical protein